MGMTTETLTAKVTTSGNSLAIRIPKPVADRLNLQAGSTVHLLEDRDGLKIIAYDPELQRQLEVAMGVQTRNAAALRALADR